MKETQKQIKGDIKITLKVCMNYRLELEINLQKRKMVELQFKAIQKQIIALHESKEELIQQYEKLCAEGQKLAEENDELSLKFLD